MFNIPPEMMGQAESIAKLPGAGMLASALQNPIVAGFASMVANAFGIPASPQMIMTGAKAASAYIDQVKSQDAQANKAPSPQMTGDPIGQFIKIISGGDAQKLFSFLQQPGVAAVASMVLGSFGIKASPAQISQGSGMVTSMAPQLASMARMPGAGFLASALQNPIIASVASMLSPLTGVPMSPEMIMAGAKGASMVVEQVKQEDMQNQNGPSMRR